MKSLTSVVATTMLLACFVMPATAQSDGRRVQIRVDERGYHPASVHVERGETVILVFTRTSEHGCGRVLVIPSRNSDASFPSIGRYRFG